MSDPTIYQITQQQADELAIAWLLCTPAGMGGRSITSPAMIAKHTRLCKKILGVSELPDEWTYKVVAP